MQCAASADALLSCQGWPYERDSLPVNCWYGRLRQSCAAHVSLMGGRHTPTRIRGAAYEGPVPGSWRHAWAVALARVDGAIQHAARPGLRVRQCSETPWAFLLARHSACAPVPSLSGVHAPHGLNLHYTGLACSNSTVDDLTVRVSVSVGASTDTAIPLSPKARRQAPSTSQQRMPQHAAVQAHALQRCCLRRS